MKNIIILILTVSIFSCKAQQVVAIYSQDDVQYNSNYYLKDVDNDFNKFLGTWKYENSNTSITFELEKEVMYQAYSGTNFQDIIVGEYQYIENGIEKVNTLNRLLILDIKGYSHKINGFNIIDKLNFKPCDDCTNSERMVWLTINHPTVNDVQSDLKLRYIVENGVEKIIARIRDSGPGVVDENRTETTNLDIPNGEYTFIKQ